ncbi:hypothetical protein PSTT_06827 [Puccinia striiformis]|uniref:Uncharacterized protein n=1 Tax=Puccinia striiformis TaxID=27350 RepID=A0A2S4VJ56_9BASI|nr:hypothetical protein PSTT_06827 [Puccinia striiformis]
MHIRQMITVLASAYPSTCPSNRSSGRRGDQVIADNLRQKHSLDHDQFHQDLAGTVNPLLRGSEKHVPYILESFLGYRSTAEPDVLKNHPKLKARAIADLPRLAVLRTGRFIPNKPEHFNADSLQDAHNKLVNLLKTNAESNPSDRSSSPEGILKEMQESFTKAATTKSHIQLNKYSREEINAKLKATNRPDVPDAILIDGQTFKSHFEGLLASHSHHHSPSAGALPNAKPVVATA